MEPAVILPISTFKVEDLLSIFTKEIKKLEKDIADLEQSIAAFDPAKDIACITGSERVVDGGWSLRPSW